MSACLFVCLSTTLLKKAEVIWGQVPVCNPETTNSANWGGRCRKERDGKYFGQHSHQLQRAATRSARAIGWNSFVLHSEAASANKRQLLKMKYEVLGFI